jgi:hypothetical protein
VHRAGIGPALDFGVPRSVHDVLGAPGRPLDPAIRSEMETRFGQDFSRVQVHTDRKAADSALAVNAAAYTVGQHLVFGEGQYDPSTRDGRRLLAHELVHAVQQTGAGVASAVKVEPPSTPAEQEAESLAADVDSLKPAVVRRPDMVLQRQVLDLRSGHHLGLVQNPDPVDNTKREAQVVLSWLLQLWSIDVPTYQSTVAKWAKYRNDDQISGADLQLLVDAIRKNEKADLANEVANNFLDLNLPAGRAVGDGAANDPNDLTAVQNALRAHQYLQAPITMPDTLVAIKLFKRDVAEGKYGKRSIRPDEITNFRDKFAAGTFSAEGDPIPNVLVNSDPLPRSRRTVTKTFSIFVPKGATPNVNQVHVFFTPYLAYLSGTAAQGFVLEQGLRAESASSPWILIAVPALHEPDSPNFVTISTDEIKRCLAAAGRTRVDIDAIRLSAHSRGARGLENTVGKVAGAKPLIDLSIVQKVTVFDAGFKDLGTALMSHRKDLTAMADPKNPSKFAPGATQLYTVISGNVSGLPATDLDIVGVRAVGFARMVKDGIERGQISPATLNSLDPSVRDATGRILAKLPARGNFSSKDPPPAGKENLQKFMADPSNSADLRLLDDPTKGLEGFVRSQNLNPQPRLSRDNQAHHWFVAELAHEAVE